MRVAVTAVVLCLLVVSEIFAATPVRSCPGGKSIEELKQSVRVGNCKKTPCRLRKKRIIKGEFRFTPDRDVKSVINKVDAIIAGIPFPFIGVDGTDACDHIFASDRTTKVGCPLHAGTEYVYKNQFEVLEIYPRLKLMVHWGLPANDGKDVMCFEVPVSITN